MPQLSAPYAIRVVPLQYIVEKSAYQNHYERCIFLPDEDVGLQFFDIYMEQLDPVQHMLHGPTTRRSVKQLYRKLQIGEHVDLNETVLLLTTLTSITSYWGLSENSSSVFASQQTAINVAVLWLRGGLDVLEHVRRTSSASMETVQAGIIIVFLIYHIEGFSPKVRAMMYNTLAAAKDLGMHRTDDAAFLPPEQSQLEIVDREMRRRLWWHLASTDWYVTSRRRSHATLILARSLALAGGPHEGTYTVNPKHMRVKRPRNISDEDLATRPADFNRPLSEPTVMGYYIQRIRLAEICREIADMVWAKDADQITVEEILGIDRMFDSLLLNLPEFLRLENGHRQKFRDLDQTEPQILVQRYVANLTIHAKRCKFHLPFLLRAAQDSTYSLSRDTCLRCARAVMQIRKDLAVEDSHLWIASSRLVGILHLYFYATMVLVMDFCVNRSTGCELARKSEIQDACKALEEAKRESGAAGMFLDSLTAILRKHSIRLQSTEQVSDYLNSAGNPKAAGADALAPGVNTQPGPSEAAAGEVDFDQLWQSYVNLEASIDPQSWDALLSDIEHLYQEPRIEFGYQSDI